MPILYSSEEFEAKYTYTGTDLGAQWQPERTRFRVWAPTASGITINLYRSGDPGADDLIEQLPMVPDVNGTWIAHKDGDLNGIYYTCLVDHWGAMVETCDPYARTTGVNGRRAMIIDLSATNPEGWDQDRNPHEKAGINDAVIYELHLRDLAMDPASGIRNAGKFLGLTETGTKTPGGIPTGLDHIKNLGVTHIHLLPVYDYGSVDESRPEENQFNWGYDPMNFNVPEGSYATDPYHGQVRVAELKQMIKTLHDNGLGVIMDVVYNHVYDRGCFCFNRIVRQYFSRVDASARYSNGSGCGNDTASERSMVRKYIVDSVKYWADEYHIDGFRFDLVGLIDTETINELMTVVHADHPSVLFYGEGWTMDTQPSKPCELTVQANAPLVPGFAFFNDSLRDALRGSVFDHTLPGFVSGAADMEKKITDSFLGRPWWCPSPTQVVNYASCHDNNTLFDRIALAVPEASVENRIRMNKLAAAIYMTSQGVPLFQAGEEILRTKPGQNGGFEENSYNLPDAVNSIKWETLEDPVYQSVYRYYQGLIALRKAHPGLRLTDAKTVSETVLPVEGTPKQVLAFRIRGTDPMFIAFNAGRAPVTLPLPPGKWHLLVDDVRAGNETIAIAEGDVTVSAIGTVVLAPCRTDAAGKRKARLAKIMGGITVGLAAVSTALLFHKNQKK